MTEAYVNGVFDGLFIAFILAALVFLEKVWRS